MPPAARRSSSPTDTIEIDPGQMQAHLAEAAQLLKALGNEQRLHILCNLLEGPLSVGELNQRLELSQSALSQHLALLRESGLVDTRREAQTIFYSLPDGPVIRVMALLQDVYCAADPASRSGDASGAGRARCED
ncbi:MAG: ArsR family transcriptional regulator, virulence s transcriptional regulator [Pseudomonadota bacterium]|nr:ArsR family transcriptional regulator, virulence s transcriptional regulator [Pseudomonadota bacterium]